MGDYIMTTLFWAFFVWLFGRQLRAALQSHGYRVTVLCEVVLFLVLMLAFLSVYSLPSTPVAAFQSVGR